MWYMGLDVNGNPNRWDSTFFENSIEVSDDIWNLHMQHPNYIWNGTTLIEYVPPYIEPVPYIPLSISPRQARLQLFKDGRLETVDYLISQQPKSVQLEWEYATSIERNNTLVIQLCTVMGMSIEDIDIMFQKASLL
jgi:hypothetical protein